MHLAFEATTSSKVSPSLIFHLQYLKLTNKREGFCWRSNQSIFAKMLCYIAAVVALVSLAAVCRAQVKVLLVSEPDQQNMVQRFEAGIKAAEDTNADLAVDIVDNIKK